MFDTAQRVIEASELFPSLALLLIFLFIGQQVAGEHPTCIRLGQLLGVGTFVLYVASRICVDNGVSAQRLIGITLRGLLAAGLVAAMAWIVLPIVVQLQSFAVLVFVRPAQRLLSGFKTERQQRKTARRAEAQQQRQQRECERRLPEREQAEREERARQAAEQAAREQQQCQRDELRLDVQLFYERYRAVLGEAFPVTQFQHYVERYLHDNLAVDILRERCNRLKATLRDFQPVAQSLNRPQFKSVEEALAHFRRRREELKALGLEPDTLDTLLISIDAAQDKTLQELLR